MGPGPVPVALGPAAPVAQGLRLRGPAGPVTVWLVDLGLACCTVEVQAALLDGELLVPDDAPAGEAGAQVVVIAGTCTERAALLVAAAVAGVPEPRRVVSFGACACTGGPYWDSYSVTKGVDTLVPVDRYVPGCPPRPQALAAAVLELAGEQP